MPCSPPCAIILKQPCCRGRCAVPGEPASPCRSFLWRGMTSEIVLICAFFLAFWRKNQAKHVWQTIAKHQPVAAELDRAPVGGVRRPVQTHSFACIHGGGVFIIAARNDAESFGQRHAVRHVPVPHQLLERALAPPPLRATTHGQQAARQEAAPRTRQ